MTAQQFFPGKNIALILLKTSHHSLCGSGRPVTSTTAISRNGVHQEPGVEVHLVPYGPSPRAGELWESLRPESLRDEEGRGVSRSALALLPGAPEQHAFQPFLAKPRSSVKRKGWVLLTESSNEVKNCAAQAQSPDWATTGWRMMRMS